MLFAASNSDPVAEFAQEQGWVVITNPPTNEHGSPILKAMYLAVYRKFHVYLYGYANGNILFDEGLHDTLLKLKISRYFNMSHLLFGRRTHELTDEIDAEQLVWQPASVAKLSQNPKHAKVGRTHEFDYFFVNQNFPLGRFSRMVIGRKGLGLYFTSYARRRLVSVIEGTPTITALQMGPDGSFERHLPSQSIQDVLYNWYILKESGIRIEEGYSFMAQYESLRHQNGSISFKCRRKCDTGDPQ